MKKIFVMICNPKEHSEKETYVQTYIEEAKKCGHEIKSINLYDLNIDYLRIQGNKSNYALTEELKQAQDNMIWADQLVFVYPIWWFAIPAVMKSFIERTFAEGIVSKLKERMPKPLMGDKTAVIMQSYDMPYFIMKYFYGDLPMKWWKVILTDWCGPKIIKRFDFDLIDSVSEKRKQKWIKDVKKFVEKL